MPEDIGLLPKTEPVVSTTDQVALYSVTELESQLIVVKFQPKPKPTATMGRALALEMSPEVAQGVQNEFVKP